MTSAPPPDAASRPIDIDARIRGRFAAQPAMALIGAGIERVADGEVDLVLPIRPELTQQHGLLHGGVTGMILDSACGFAALTRMPADAGVLTIEYKLNLLAAGTGRHVRALGKVRKSGRSIVVAEGEAFALDDDGRARLMATMTATLMVVRDRPGVRD